MKILIDARELKTSSGRYVERLLFYLQRIDNVNDYIILLKSKDLDSFEIVNQNFTKTECPFKEFTFSEQFGLLNQINGLKADLVHFAFPQQPILYGGKTVTTIHDLTTLRFDNPAKNKLYFKIKQFIYAQVIKRAVKKASKVIVPSKYVADDLANFSKIIKSNISVTYEAADIIKDQAEPVLEVDGQKFLVYVGRPNPHKNLKKLIDAFVKVSIDYPDIKLVLAGKKDTNYLLIEKYIEEQKIKNVVFAGFVSEGQLKWLYENCLAYLFPSFSEGFGLPGLEAMIHGAPVISSNATCLPEIYGDAAIYFNPHDIKDMADKIIRLLSSDSLRKELISKGYSQAKKYSWQKMAEQTLSIYNKALEDS